MASTWQALKAQWILISRSTDASLVAIYWLLQVRSRVIFNCFETLMVNKCRILEETLLGSVFMTKRRSGLENDYRPSSPTRGKGPEEIIFALEP